SARTVGGTWASSPDSSASEMPRCGPRPGPRAPRSDERRQARGAMIDLAERSILITGGASGIGNACAELAASLGARVTVADVEAGGVVEELSYVSCDARDPE